jgi:hypothetical protein
VSREAPFHRRLWREPWFRRLAADGKLLYVWAFTNEYGYWSGLFEIARDQVEDETGLAPRRLAAALEELRAAGKLFYEGDVVWVKAQTKLAPFRNRNMARNIRRQVECVNAHHPLRMAFLHEYGDQAWLAEEFKDLHVPEGAPEPSLGGGPEGVLGGSGHPGEGPIATATAIAKEVPTTSVGVVSEIFEHWVAARSKRGHSLTPGRRERIQTRLREFSVEQLKRAIDGVANDDWEDRPKHDDLTIIFKNGEQVEKFLELADKPLNRPPLPAEADLRCKGCQSPIDVFRFRNRSRLCEGCQLREDEAA